MKTLRVNVPEPTRRIELGETVFSLGSCFAEEMAKRLARVGCEVCVNPFGTIYNAASMATIVERVLSSRDYTAGDFVEHQGRWFSFEHATDLWGETLHEAITRANEALHEGNRIATKAKVFILTYGTSVVYSHHGSSAVANCHKLPHAEFQKQMLSVDENRTFIAKSVQSIRAACPAAFIVLTVSPVRHTPQDLCQNGESKANLRAAVAQVAATGQALYFPAFEMTMDELRDRHFYAGDGVHLQPHAVARIASRFSRHYFSAELQSFQRALQELRRMWRHRHLQPNSPAARQFDDAVRKKTAEFQKQYPKEILDRLALLFPRLGGD